MIDLSKRAVLKKNTTTATTTNNNTKTVNSRILFFALEIYKVCECGFLGGPDFWHPDFRTLLLLFYLFLLLSLTE